MAYLMIVFWQMSRFFVQERGLTHLLPELKKGALVAQDPMCISI
jgi:hypothetical protein